MNKNKQRHSYKKPLDIKEYTVKRSCILLEFLLENLTGLSRNNIKNLLKNHQVAVDGAPISQFNFQLAKDDVVIISKNRIKMNAKKEKIKIIYEDDEVIVINKPSKLLSVASDKVKGRTAYRLVTDYLQATNGNARVFVVHRLDEDTSGVLMFAKNEKIRDLLQKNWDKLVLKRGYYAIVDGEVEKEEDTLIHYLIQNKLNLMIVTHDKKKGKRCITHYKRMKVMNNRTLLDVNIDSGRKNQIRVQLGNIGHFVIGDDKYGEPSNPLKRLGLHAYTLHIKHPETGKLMKFLAPIPKDFKLLFQIERL